MSDTGRQGDKALQEFLSEAQEIVEAFNRGLLRLDEQRAAGRVEPEVINDAFRAVHSLKGVSGLFGLTRMTQLAHTLENMLDGLRLGKLQLTPALLDLLFESVEVFHRLVADARPAAPDALEGAPHSEGVSVDDLCERLDRVVAPGDVHEGPSAWGGFELDPSLLSGLTEYEEHRLRENIKEGRDILRLQALFPLLTIDTGLDDLKTRLRPYGEVITLLPLPSPMGDDQSIALDVLFGSTKGSAQVAAAVEGLKIQVLEVPRKSRPAGVTNPPVPPVAAAPLTATNTPRQRQTKESRRVAAPATVDPPAHPDDSAAAGPLADHLDELEERATTLRSVSQTVRVDIRKLDHLMNVVGELTLARSGIQAVLDEIKLDRTRTVVARSLHREVRNLGRKLDELQAGILEVRMVPLGQIFDKLSRVVRKISREAGKEIRLSISGAETEIDKLIVEELSDPLMHVIRNCIDHGIEPPDVRRALGKPETGTINITAEQRGNHVVIAVEDDGAGIAHEKLVERAIARGFIDAQTARDLNRRDVLNLIFLPGVSTKDVVDEVSGRGVGMDVVKTNISRLSGIIDVESELGTGTRLTITLPITLAIIQALVVRVAGRTYAIPLNSVLEALMVQRREVRTIERREIITLRGSTLPLLRLERLFRLERPGVQPDKHFVVVVGMAQHRIGIMVDELIGQQDIVIKPIGRVLESIPGIAGATELGGQQTVLVLDVASLVEEALSDREAA